MNTHGMEILQGLLAATPAAEAGRADPRAYELPRQLIEARRLLLEGDVNAAEVVLRAALGAIESVSAHPYSAGLPFGYETYYGFIKRVRPSLLNCVDDLTEFCEEAEADARRLCAERGLKVVTTRAHPDVVAEGGDPFCPAFPLAILEKVYTDICVAADGDSKEIWI